MKYFMGHKSLTECLCTEIKPLIPTNESHLLDLILSSSKMTWKTSMLFDTSIQGMATANAYEIKHKFHTHKWPVTRTGLAYDSAHTKCWANDKDIKYWTLHILFITQKPVPSSPTLSALCNSLLKNAQLVSYAKTWNESYMYTIC